MKALTRRLEDLENGYGRLRSRVDGMEARVRARAILADPEALDAMLELDRWLSDTAARRGVDTREATDNGGKLMAAWAAEDPVGAAALERAGAEVGRVFRAAGLTG